MNGSVDLDDKAWAETRNAVTQRFLGVDAAEFTRLYREGFYEGENEPDFLMDVLAYFPELD